MCGPARPDTASLSEQRRSPDVVRTTEGPRRPQRRRDAGIAELAKPVPAQRHGQAVACTFPGTACATIPENFPTGEAHRLGGYGGTSMGGGVDGVDQVGGSRAKGREGFELRLAECLWELAGALLAASEASDWVERMFASH